MKKLMAVSLISLALGCSAGAAEYSAVAPHAYTKPIPKLIDRFPSVNKAAYRVPVYTGKPANDISDKRHSMRTRLRQALKGGTNFAGHYAIAMYGCGTGCLGLSMVDVKSGKIYDNAPAPVTMHYAMDKAGHFTEMGMDYSKDSTLLYLTGEVNEYGAGSFLFSFENGKFRLVKHSPLVEYEHPENN